MLNWTALYCTSCVAVQGGQQTVRSGYLPHALPVQGTLCDDDPLRSLRATHPQVRQQWPLSSSGRLQHQAWYVNTPFSLSFLLPSFHSYFLSFPISPLLLRIDTLCLAATILYSSSFALIAILRTSCLSAPCVEMWCDMNLFSVFNLAAYSITGSSMYRMLTEGEVEADVRTHEYTVLQLYSALQCYLYVWASCTLCWVFIYSYIPHIICHDQPLSTFLSNLLFLPFFLIRFLLSDINPSCMQQPPSSDLKGRSKVLSSICPLSILFSATISALLLLLT